MTKIKRFLLYVIVGSSVLISTMLLCQRYVLLNTTASLPGKIYLINHNKEFKRNALVVFCHTEAVNHFIQMIKPQYGSCPATHATPNLKIIAGVPGDQVFADGHREIRINGEFFEGSSTKPKFPSWHFDGVIPPHKYLLLTHHRDGLDSRYFGLIDEKQLISTIKCIF